MNMFNVMLAEVSWPDVAITLILVTSICVFFWIMIKD